MDLWLVEDFVLEEAVGVFSSEKLAKEAIHELIRDMVIGGSTKDDYTIKKIKLDTIMEQYLG